MKIDLTRAEFRTSSYTGNGEACVEVADLPEHNAVRDSKDRAGTVLVVGRGQWEAFIAHTRADRFA